MSAGIPRPGSDRRAVAAGLLTASSRFLLDVIWSPVHRGDLEPAPESLSLCLCAASSAGTRARGAGDHSCRPAKQTDINTRARLVWPHAHARTLFLVTIQYIPRSNGSVSVSAHGRPALTAANAATAVLTADKWHRS